ncbi:MAG: hypothetical protein C0404_06500 [Verrucomicrobia bacterium]|nr:hypothetical protein [Verrucomicrobiota bacterium]
MKGVLAMEDNQTSDSDIVRQIMDGDKELYRVLVQRHRRRLHVMANRLLPRKVVCEDAVQEVFVRAYFKLHDFRADGNFGGWLTGILRNVVGDEYRKTARMGEIPFKEGHEYGIDGAEETPVPDRNERFAELLGQCMETLAEKSRSAFKMRYEQQRKGKEIGSLIQMTESAVNVLLLRTRDHLRKCMESHMRTSP